MSESGERHVRAIEEYGEVWDRFEESLVLFFEVSNESAAEARENLEPELDNLKASMFETFRRWNRFNFALRREHS